MANEFRFNWGRAPQVANDVMPRTSWMQNKYGQVFDPSAADRDDIEIMQREIGTDVDGIWGPKSQTAYNKYMQSQMGVTPDGIWGPKTQAAYDAGYYNPAYSASQEAYAQAQLNAQAQAEEQERELLRAEYEQNVKRILQLKMEVERLGGESDRYMNDLDMRLAANRARVGDMSNAMMHQLNLITRRQLAANSPKSTETKEAEDLVEEYIKTQSMMMMGDNSQRPGYQNMLNFLDRKIQKNPKAKKILADFNRAYGSGGSNLELPRTFQDFTNFVSDKRTANAGNTVKKNGLSNADKEAIAEFWFSLPKEVRDANKEEFNKLLSEDSIETTQARVNALRKKQRAALDEAKKHIIPSELDNTGSQEYTASNGQKVTITRSGYGTVVLQIGNLTESMKY